MSISNPRPMNGRSMPAFKRALLWAAIAVPFLYYGTLLVSASLYPGYSHLTQYASELGSAQAPYPAIFNAGTVLNGAAIVAASLGFFYAVIAVGARPVLALLAAVCLALFGASMILGGVFPMPDPRHGGFGIGMAVHLVPFVLAFALWKRPELRTLASFLLINGLIMLGLFVVMMGVGSLVTRSNVGLFQRAYSLTVFPWVGIAGYVLLRKSKQMH